MKIEPVLTLHIQAVGSWTTRLHDKIKSFGETKNFHVFYFENQFRLWSCLSRIFCCSRWQRSNYDSFDDSRRNPEGQHLISAVSTGGTLDDVGSLANNYQSTLLSHSIDHIEEEIINDMIAVRYVDAVTSNNHLIKKPKVIKFFKDNAAGIGSSNMLLANEIQYSPSNQFSSPSISAMESTNTFRDDDLAGIPNMMANEFQSSNHFNSPSTFSMESTVESFSVIPENEVLFRPSGDFSLTITLDGPFGAPTSRIFWERSHAVLIGAGIGVTPCASVLRSIMERHKSSKIDCPGCDYSFTHTPTLHQQLHNLKQVDFFWINREQTSFTWFVDLLYQLEIEQEQLIKDGEKKFLNIHMYMTKALKRNDMKAVGLQLALDLRYMKQQKELQENDKRNGNVWRKQSETGSRNNRRERDEKGKIGLSSLKTRLNAGRPNWDDIFQKLREDAEGRKIAIFYCGPPRLKKDLGSMCERYNFDFYPEVF